MTTKSKEFNLPKHQSALNVWQKKVLSHYQNQNASLICVVMGIVGFSVFQFR